jgi:hypothetical protein
MLRHDVPPNGRSALSIMEFQNMSVEDVLAVISHLGTAPPDRNEIPENRWNLLGKTIMATMIGPLHPDGAPPATCPVAEATIERGSYLASTVANRAGCAARAT